MDYKYNPKTKRFTLDEEEKATPAETESIRVDKVLVAKLATFAIEDKLDLNGTTEQSKGIKRNKVVRLYAEKALTEFIQARK